MEKGWVSSEFIVKSKKKDYVVISGYASVFDVVDYHNDIVIKGAFKGLDAKKVKLLWQHNITKPIGIITFLKEDEYGLVFEAEINTNIKTGAEAASLVKQEAVCGISIGFNINSFDYRKDGTRIIDSIDLKEISIVTFPANEYAEIQNVKKLDSDCEMCEEAKLDELQNLINQAKRSCFIVKKSNLLGGYNDK